MDLIFEQYADRLRRRNRSSHTVSGFVTAARRFSQWLAAVGVPAERVTYEVMEDYFDQLDLAPQSKWTHLKHLRSAYGYAVRRGTLRHNPALDLELEALPDTEPRIIPIEELRAMRDGITLERDWLFFHLLAYTGMRRSEVIGLRWEAVDLPGETLRVLGKGRKLRLVPIHPALHEELGRAKRATPFVVHSWGRDGCASDTVVRMTRRLSDVYTPHDFRRTVATSLKRNGVEERLIDRILGWAPRAVRDRYYINVADEELKRAILKLYADDPL